MYQKGKMTERAERILINIFEKKKSVLKNKTKGTFTEIDCLSDFVIRPEAMFYLLLFDLSSYLMKLNSSHVSLRLKNSSEAN